MQIDFFADSFGVGQGASTPSTTDYLSRLCLAYPGGISNNNYSRNGAVASDLGVQLMAAPTGNAIVELGVNDLLQAQLGYAGSAQNEQTWLDCMSAFIVWKSLPCIKAQSLPQSAFAGAWTNMTYWGGGIGKTAQGAGASVTFGFTGPVLYIGATEDAASTGNWQVSIDGTVVGSYSSNAAAYTGRPWQPFGPRAIRIPVGGAPAASHTCTITLNDASGASPNINFDYFATPGMAPAGVPRPVIWMCNLCRQMGGPGFSYGNNDATVYSYGQALASLVAAFVADGLDARLVDNWRVIDPTADLVSDGLHPNDTGHYKIFAGIFQLMMFPVTMRVISGQVYACGPGQIVRTN